jgi:hypothetical protein
MLLETPYQNPLPLVECVMRPAARGRSFPLLYVLYLSLSPRGEGEFPAA